MPIVSSSFRPAPGLRSAHLQTILPALAPRFPRPPFRRERLELTDGDFLDLDWLDRQLPRLAILCSGLEGSSRDPGMSRLAATFHAADFDVLSWNFRGRSGEPNRLARSYHSGATEDLHAVVTHALRIGPARPTALVGCSLGGNLLLKYLGEAPPPAHITGAVAISPPIDLAATAHALDQRPANRFYRRRLIDSLSANVRAKALIHPEQIDTTRLAGIHGFADFDDRFTAPAHGFRDAAEYWTKCSARQFLPAIRIPTLILTARDDPFMTPASFPDPEATASPHLFLESPHHGGHLGFIHAFPPNLNWAPQRATNFLTDAPL